MNQHTPGPWKVATTYKAAQLGRFSIRTWKDQTYSLATVKVPSKRAMDVAEAAANARLIAKAPEMYALLQGFLDSYTRVRPAYFDRAALLLREINGEDPHGKNQEEAR